MKVLKKITFLVGGMSAGILCMVLLYLESERIIHYKNNFTRRYLPHVAVPLEEADLKVNSYYFAGYENGKIYLGNSTAPLKMTILDTALNVLEEHFIEVDRKDMPFRRPNIKVSRNRFYLFEGSAPYIFTGSTSDWSAKLKTSTGRYFSKLVPADSAQMIIRFIAPKTGESVIGIINIEDTTKISYAPRLLKKQLDGIFDTDGDLEFDNSTNKIIYLYRYRNLYIVAGLDLQVESQGNTIDTVARAQINIVKVESKNYSTFSKPPLVVNRMMAVDKGLLYVNATLPGEREKEWRWKKTSVIDVYRLKDHSYRSSFSIYDIANKKIKSFIVRDGKLYALIGEKIVSYRLSESMAEI